MPRAGRLLVVGAHAFDAEAMAGGLVAAWPETGNGAAIAHVSMGEAGHQEKTAEQYSSQKRDEATRAAQVLGAEVHFLGHPDGAVADVPDLAKEIARLVQEVQPSTVVTHWKGSWHPDHAATHRAVLHGLILAGLGLGSSEVAAHCPDELLFAENWEDAEDFRPVLYADVTPGFDRWQTALAQYEIGKAKAPGFPYRDYYAALARCRGCLSDVTYAEAFLPAPQDLMRGLGQRRGTTPYGQAPD